MSNEKFYTNEDVYNFEYNHEKITDQINEELWISDKEKWKYILTKKWENALVTLSLEISKEKFNEWKYIESLKYSILYIKYKIEFAYKELTNR